jgi:hypothetical protein
MCNLVGPYKGIKLFEADFNPSGPPTHITSHNKMIQQDSSNQHTIHKKSDSFLSQESNENILLQTIKLDDIEDNEPMNEAHVPRARFQTSVCKMLGISLEINERPFLAGKKLIDEHYEYLIEIKLGEKQEDHWFIFRRYSKIRKLHEQMSILYPTLNCLVFPIRQLFNNQLINRQLQLEHYLKCFLEILINDSTCPIYLFAGESKTSRSPLDTVSNSSSLNSISSMSSNIYQTSSNYSSSYNNYYSSNLNSNVSNSIALTNGQTSLSRSRLCQFCAFFEQTQSDRNLLKILEASNLAKRYRKRTNSFLII